jgi:hypothetical protein
MLKAKHMLKITRLTSVASAGIALLALSATVKAQVITQTFSVPTTATAFSDPITYNLFNSNLGVLQSVTLSLTSTVTANVNFYNFTELGGPFGPPTTESYTNATASVPVSVGGPGGLTASVTGTAGPFSGSSSVFETVIPGAPQTLSDSVTITSGLGVWESPPGSATGTLTASAGAGTYGGSSVTGLTAFGGSATANEAITLTFTYTPPVATPEPGAWALVLASASVSFAGLLRKRATKVA